MIKIFLLAETELKTVLLEVAGTRCCCNAMNWIMLHLVKIEG